MPNNKNLHSSDGQASTIARAFPYAYRPDPARPDKLLIHASESGIVRSLYMSVLTSATALADGFGVAGEIAAALNVARTPAPFIDGRRPPGGWSEAVVIDLIGDPRHIGLMLEGDEQSSEIGQAPSMKLDKDLAIVAPAIFAAANEILNAPRWPATKALIAAALSAPLDLIAPERSMPSQVVASRAALMTAQGVLPAPMAMPVSEDAEAMRDDELAALSASPAVAALRALERQPFEKDRAVFKVFDAEALPAPSRRKLTPSRETRGRLRRKMFFYARYSTDMQEVKSEARQFADMAPYAANAGFDEDGRYGDRGLTGKAMHNRPGLQAMLQSARLKRPDAICVEDLDRLSRRLPDLLAIFYELKMLGIELHDITLGKLDLIHIVMRGYMAEEGRVRFLAMSRRGKIQALRDGKLISKGAYGYYLDPTMKGIHLVDEQAKEVVQWIFKWIADGMSAGECARELTRRGIYPPAQWRTLRDGGSVAKIKAWQPMTILKIVHNHVYLGWVTLNRSVRVVDLGSGKTKGFEQSDEKDWIVVKHEDLAIVDEDTWTRAAMRLAELTYRGEKSIARFLLTGKAKCPCGAPLKAHTITDYTTYYECSSRVLGSGCKVKDHHRIEWLETAVLEKLLNSAFGRQHIENYAATFEAEIARILDRDIRRTAEIRRRLEKIDDLQQQSFETHGSVPPKRIAKIRFSLEAEYERLEEEVGTLLSPKSFLGVLQAVKNVEGDLSRMLEEVPFRPTDPEGISMANAVRDAIDEVVVYPCDASGWTRVSIVVDYLARFRDTAGVADMGRIVLETGFDTKVLRETMRRQRDADRFGTTMAEAAEDGRYDLSDAEWAIVEPLVHRLDLKRNGKIVARDLFDGMICFARANGPLDRIPSRYGDKDVFRRAVKRFVYAGLWDVAKQRLENHGCTWLNEPGFARFDTLEFPRRNGGERPDDAAAARARQELLALAAAEPEGDPVRLRLEFIAMVLAKEAISDAARALGLSLPSAYHHWDKYKARGIDAVRRKDDRYKDAKLCAEQIQVLKDIATAGVDPDEPSEFITYPILCRICEAKFGVVYSRGGMVQLARRHGFLLQGLVGAERRRRNIAAGYPTLPPAVPRRISPLQSRRTATPAGKKARRDARETGKPQREA